MILGQINTNNLKKLLDRTKSFKISVAAKKVFKIQ